MLPRKGVHGPRPSLGCDGKNKAEKKLVKSPPAQYYLTGATKTRQSPSMIWPPIRPGNDNKDDLITLTTKAQQAATTTNQTNLRFQ